MLLLLAVPAWAGLGKGDTFPRPAGNMVSGPKATFAGHVTLVDFWASWCGPCKLSFPALERLYKTYGPRGLQIVAISVDESAEDMQSFLEDFETTFTVLHDASQQLVATAGIETMPTSFLVDASGRVISVHSGFAGPKTEKELAAEIERALAGVGGKAE